MLGERIKKLREEKEISQKSLSNYLGVSPSTIGMYEQDRRTPDSDMILKIANYFDVTTDYLLGASEIKNIRKETLNERKKLSPEVETIAAHLEDKDITPKKMKLIKNYIDALFDEDDD